VLCDRVAVMDRGRVIACDTPLALIRNLDIAATVRARVASGQLPPADLAALPGVMPEETPPVPPEILLRTSDAQATLTALLALATRNGVTLANLASTQANLEDVFLSLTGRTYDDEAVSHQPSAVSKGRRSP
jgi:ABC-2 type transport system ATP-binding protein